MLCIVLLLLVCIELSRSMRTLVMYAYYESYIIIVIYIHTYIHTYMHYEFAYYEY